MMNLRKDNWKKVKLSDVCAGVLNIDQRKQKGTFNYVDIGSINSGLNRINEIQELDWNNASSRARQIIQKYDTLFSTVRVNLQRVALVDDEIPDGIASTGFTVLRANRDVIHPLYIFYNAISPKFLDRLTKLQVGTAYPAVTDKMVLSQEIILPPLDEQERIVELFQSVEQAILHAEGQEENLKSLRKALINKITRGNPVFGNLIDPKKCKKVSVGGVSIEISDRTDNPSESGFDKFVGLENFESGELNISSWSSTDGLVSAMKLFKAEDVLFARRNAYLKRTSKVDFDGVCSGDAIVIRTNPDMTFPMFLTLTMNTDEFWNFAISNAAGTMSKRVKWRDLETYSFVLPDMETQQTMVKVFEQVETCLAQIRQQKETLKKLKQKLLNEILG